MVQANKEGMGGVERGKVSRPYRRSAPREPTSRNKLITDFRGNGGERDGGGDVKKR